MSLTMFISRISKFVTNLEDLLTLFTLKNQNISKNANLGRKCNLEKNILKGVSKFLKSWLLFHFLQNCSTYQFGNFWQKMITNKNKCSTGISTTWSEKENWVPEFTHKILHSCLLSHLQKLLQKNNWKCSNPTGKSHFDMT